ncbi:MAG: hypothetical protein SGPRY_005071 [Prymnesium sp.]
MRPVADSSRTASAYSKMPLVMSANVNPGFIHNRQRYLQSETARAYAFQKTGPVEKDHHFVKDPVKQFVEKALELHDACRSTDNDEMSRLCAHSAHGYGGGGLSSVGWGLYEEHGYREGLAASNKISWQWLAACCAGP